MMGVRDDEFSIETLRECAEILDGQPMPVGVMGFYEGVRFICSEPLAQDKPKQDKAWYRQFEKRNRKCR